jgi:AraC-like DNA-binding protein
LKFYTIPPSKKLAEFVQYFWVIKGSASADNPFAMRTFAYGFPQLIFHKQGIFNRVQECQSCRKTSFKSGIHGQTNKYLDIDISENFEVIGVELFPYSLQTFFGIPAQAFLNQFPDLYSVIDSDDLQYSDCIINANNAQEGIAIISRFLELKIGEFTNPEIIFAVKKIIERQGILNIKKLADDCCRSQRHFERKFKELTGFTAKTFSRIIRFNSLRNNANYKNKSLTDIALDFGYFDQSHFINEFREFSGYSPKAFFSNMESD